MEASNIYEAIEGAQAVILTTEWDEFINLDWIEAKQYITPPYIVIDGRNVLQPRLMKEIGYDYIGIGRNNY
ncbi:MAG: hypothetical protein K9L17_08925 [Clostridiales bacterium]|nr:hypothetical protein [Clostridiales bacterium]MCF8022800.1 hypothetical protein [Clostridiales bacterium]